MKKLKPEVRIVLVAVLKNKRDFNILLTKKWYRIPVAHSPKIKFSYLAFYQPAIFGRAGKCIRYYARVLNHQVVKRIELLPAELNHPRANDFYFKFQRAKIKKLPHPIRNIIPRRVSFGFTTLNHLLKSKNILELYNVAPIEQIIGDSLERAGIEFKSQPWVMGQGRRYRLDLAIFCRQGKIAIECDNKKAHSSRQQCKKDKIKSAFLRKHGWTVIRLREQNIINNLAGCLNRVQETVQRLRGNVDKI